MTTSSVIYNIETRFSSFLEILAMRPLLSTLYIYATGIGGQTALKLIRQHGSIENILENINKERFILYYCTFILHIRRCMKMNLYLLWVHFFVLFPGLFLQ